MRKIALIGLFLFAILFAGCEDEGSAEINVICKDRGQSKNVWVEVYNSKGVQVKQVSTQGGIGYVTDLPAGTYTLKFKNHDDTYFSAIKVVTVADGDSRPVDVELNDPPDEGGSVE
ncbi:T9SS type A sorting domain-containing protein [bacterium]|nr:T9SS type A sorting domain-containing protein [bacterium]